MVHGLSSINKAINISKSQFHLYLCLEQVKLMKFRLITLLSLAMMFSLGACHYGEEAVKEDVKRNEEYKGIRAEREAATALPADAADKMNGTAPADTTAADTAAVAP